MASTLVGRTACPECGFQSAHVKQSEKCLYRYCPECGAQHHARTDRQRADLEAKTRRTDAPTPTAKQSPTATPSEPTPTPTPTGDEPTATATPTPAKRRGLFS